MYEMTAYCGVDCSACPGYIATQKGDMEGLAKLAREWSQQFVMEIPSESLLCDGCKSETGRLCGYCSICAVHACAGDRGVITCAHCDDYACEILQNCPAYKGAGLDTLERIKAELSD